jgi:uncharacterized protein (DUF849 family)
MMTPALRTWLDAVLPRAARCSCKKLKPGICTLDFNTMNSGAQTIINTPRNLETMTNIINEVGTWPEVEIFDSSDLNMAKDFINRGLLQ